MKTLFIIGTCLRLLNNDPWTAPTYEIVQIGRYSYRVFEHKFNEGQMDVVDDTFIKFNAIKDYEKVNCK